MIFPEPRRDRTNLRGIAFLTTLVLAVALYGLLLISGVSIKEANRVAFREINLNGLLAQRVNLGSVDATPANALNLLEYNPGSGQDGTPPEDAILEEESSGNETQDAAPEPIPEEQPVEDPPKVEEEPAADPPPPAEEDETPEDPEPDTVQADNQNVDQAPETSVAGNGGAEYTSPASGDMGIERQALAAFGSDYKNLEIREIIEWMKENPAELPKGIRQLVRFRPAFLSSATSFTMDGKDYELYLMCKESLFEVHVVLVDENEAIYLVDRSFQKLSTYLRKGQVRRTSDQQIVAVRSNMASNAGSEEFYSLFLSWWDWAKKPS